MFGSRKSSNISNHHTLVSRATRLEGDIHFAGELQIEGKVVGNITAEPGQEARIVVAETGLVEGDIRVPSAVINGFVQGDIHSSTHIELAAKAVVAGNVNYISIEMVKGSQVNGSLICNDTRKAPEPLLISNQMAETAAD